MAQRGLGHSVCRGRLPRGAVRSVPARLGRSDWLSRASIGSAPLIATRRLDRSKLVRKFGPFERSRLAARRRSSAPR